MLAGGAPSDGGAASRGTCLYVVRRDRDKSTHSHSRRAHYLSSSNRLCRLWRVHVFLTVVTAQGCALEQPSCRHPSFAYTRHQLHLTTARDRGKFGSCAMMCGTARSRSDMPMANPVEAHTKMQSERLTIRNGPVPCDTAEARLVSAAAAAAAGAPCCGC